MRVQLPECEKWHLEGLIHQNLIFHQSVPLMCMCIENKPCKKKNDPNWQKILHRKILSDPQIKNE